MNSPIAIAVDEIAARLKESPLDVAREYAPGGYVSGPQYWTRDPGRPDRKIGSFLVTISGPYLGKWHDYSADQHGDLLDLIQRALNTDKKGAVQEAMRYLRILEETPEQRRERLKRAAENTAKLAETESPGADAEAKAAYAYKLWLNCAPSIADTPVEQYLRGRGIDLRPLGRYPGSLRYAPNLKYKDVDPQTGEVIEGEWPAMVAAIAGPGAEGQTDFMGVHRTWLAKDAEGNWRKAPVPKNKKMLGKKKGGCIRIWTGEGLRGGKAAPMAKAPAGSKIVITEGIEDALSVVVLRPDLRVIAAGDLGNIPWLKLPEAFSEIVICADNDAGKQAIRTLESAVVAFRAQGRNVLVWRNEMGGKDINDALVATLRESGS